MGSAELSAAQGEPGRHDPADLRDLGLALPQFLAQVVTIVSVSWGLKVAAFATGFLANQLAYGIVYFLLVFLFTYFYTAITFNPEEVAKNLQQSGGLSGHPSRREYLQVLFGCHQSHNALGCGGSRSCGHTSIVVQRLTGVATLTVSGTAI